MADRTIQVLTPATETDLLTLDEAKLWLNIPLTDTSQDAVLASMITTFSEEIAERLNRHPTVTLGYEEVTETWRGTMNGRLFLSHWPVKASDIISVTVGDTTLSVTPFDTTLAATDYELEEASGKLSNIINGGSQAVPWNDPVVVHYSGGYSLPDECPLPLKHCVVMLIREEKIRMLQMQTAGIRQISHKEARVSFFDPNALLIRSVSMKSPTIQAIESILTHYMRFEV
jgi:hypothetical protein